MKINFLLFGYLVTLAHCSPIIEMMNLNHLSLDSSMETQNKTLHYGLTSSASFENQMALFMEKRDGEIPISSARTCIGSNIISTSQGCSVMCQGINEYFSNTYKKDFKTDTLCPYENSPGNSGPRKGEPYRPDDFTRFQSYLDGCFECGKKFNNLYYRRLVAMELPCNVKSPRNTPHCSKYCINMQKITPDDCTNAFANVKENIASYKKRIESEGKDITTEKRQYHSCQIMIVRAFHVTLAYRCNPVHKDVVEMLGILNTCPYLYKRGFLDECEIISSTSSTTKPVLSSSTTVSKSSASTIVDKSTSSTAKTLPASTVSNISSSKTTKTTSVANTNKTPPASTTIRISTSTRIQSSSSTAKKSSSTSRTILSTTTTEKSSTTKAPTSTKTQPSSSATKKDSSTSIITKTSSMPTTVRVSSKTTLTTTTAEKSSASTKTQSSSSTTKESSSTSRTILSTTTAEKSSTTKAPTSTKTQPSSSATKKDSSTTTITKTSSLSTTIKASSKTTLTTTTNEISIPTSTRIQSFTSSTKKNSSTSTTVKTPSISTTVNFSSSVKTISSTATSKASTTLTATRIPTTTSSSTTVSSKLVTSSVSTTAKKSSVTSAYNSSHPTSISTTTASSKSSISVITTSSTSFRTTTIITYVSSSKYSNHSSFTSSLASVKSETSSTKIISSTSEKSSLPSSQVPTYPSTFSTLETASISSGDTDSTRSTKMSTPFSSVTTSVTSSETTIYSTTMKTDISSNITPTLSSGPILSISLSSSLDIHSSLISTSAETSPSSVLTTFETFSSSTLLPTEGTTSTSTIVTSSSVIQTVTGIYTIIPQLRQEECVQYCNYLVQKIKDSGFSQNDICPLVGDFDKQYVANCLLCATAYKPVYNNQGLILINALAGCNLSTLPDRQYSLVPIFVVSYVTMPVPNPKTSSFISSDITNRSTTGSTKVQTTSATNTAPPGFTQDECSKYCDYLLDEIKKHSLHANQFCPEVALFDKQIVANCLLCATAYELVFENRGLRVINALVYCKQNTVPGRGYSPVPTPIISSTDTSTSGTNTASPFSQEECSKYCNHLNDKITQTELLQKEVCPTVALFDKQYVANCLLCASVYKPVHDSNGSKIIDTLMSCKLGFEPDLPYSNVPITDGSTPSSTSVTGAGASTGISTITPEFSQEECSKYCDFLVHRLNNQDLLETQVCLTVARFDKQYVANCLLCASRYQPVYDGAGSTLIGSLAYCKMNTLPDRRYSEMPISDGFTITSQKTSEYFGTRTRVSSSKSIQTTSAASNKPFDFTQDECSKYCDYLLGEIRKHSLHATQFCPAVAVFDKQIVANCLLCANAYEPVFESQGANLIDSLAYCKQVTVPDREYSSVPIPTQSASFITGTSSSQTTMDTTTPGFTQEECSKYCDYLDDKITEARSFQNKLCPTVIHFERQYVANCLLCASTYKPVYEDKGSKIIGTLVYCKVASEPDRPYSSVPIIDKTTATPSLPATSSTLVPDFSQEECSKYCDFLVHKLNDQDLPVGQICSPVARFDKQYVANCLLCASRYQSVYDGPGSALIGSIAYCKMNTLPDRKYSPVSIVDAYTTVSSNKYPYPTVSSGNGSPSSKTNTDLDDNNNSSPTPGLDDSDDSQNPKPGQGGSGNSDSGNSKNPNDTDSSGSNNNGNNGNTAGNGNGDGDKNDNDNKNNNDNGNDNDNLETPDPNGNGGNGSDENSNPNSGPSSQNGNGGTLGNANGNGNGNGNSKSVFPDSNGNNSPGDSQPNHNGNGSKNGKNDPNSGPSNQDSDNDSNSNSDLESSNSNDNGDGDGLENKQSQQNGNENESESQSEPSNQNGNGGTQGNANPNQNNNDSGTNFDPNNSLSKDKSEDAKVPNSSGSGSNKNSDGDSNKNSDDYDGSGSGPGSNAFESNSKELNDGKSNPNDNQLNGGNQSDDNISNTDPNSKEGQNNQNKDTNPDGSSNDNGNSSVGDSESDGDDSRNNSDNSNNNENNSGNGSQNKGQHGGAPDKNGESKDQDHENSSNRSNNPDDNGSKEDNLSSQMSGSLQNGNNQDSADGAANDENGFNSSDGSDGSDGNLSQIDTNSGIAYANPTLFTLFFVTFAITLF